MRVGRQARALVVASGLHALAGMALRFVPAAAPVSVSRPPPIELETIARTPSPSPSPAVAIAPRPAPQRTAPAVLRHASPPRAIEPPAAREPPSSMPPSSEPPSGTQSLSMRGGARGTDLFPRGVLQDLAGHGAAPPARAAEGNGSDGSSHGAQADRERETPGGWLSDAAAEARTKSGQVAPVWRDAERALTQRFTPPPSSVHDEPPTRGGRAVDRLKTYVQQMIATVGRGEEGIRHPNVPGSRALDIGVGGFVDPSQQGFQGVPEGMNLRAAPLAQQLAVQQATGDPARWLRVEIEITVDAAGRIARARVAFPSGRRAFDRYALATVRDAVAHDAEPSTVSRWVCEAGYAVSQPTSVGINFDVMMLFDKKLRSQLAARYPGQERVDTKVFLKWVKPLP